MINLSLPSFLMSTMPSAYLQDQCFDLAGTSVGLSGPLLVPNETTKRVNIEHKGGEACGCSYVSNSLILCIVMLNTLKMRCLPKF